MSSEEGNNRTLVRVSFRFPGNLAPSAQRISVLGPFNAWSAGLHPLIRAGTDWATSIYLAPGRIVYGFDVDGVFWLDPADEGRVLNAWGTEYSTRHVSPAGALPDPVAFGFPSSTWTADAAEYRCSPRPRAA